MILPRAPTVVTEKMSLIGLFCKKNKERRKQDRFSQIKEQYKSAATNRVTADCVK